MYCLTRSRTLRPGGTIEVIEMDVEYISDDGTVLPDNHLRVFLQTLRQAMRSRGIAIDIAPELSSLLTEAGFKDLRCEKPKLPLGWWPKDPRLKEIGLWHFAQFMDGLPGIMTGVLTNMLDWDSDRVEEMLAKVQESVRDPKIHGYWRK